jgi:hypothetical protein
VNVDGNCQQACRNRDGDWNVHVVGPGGEEHADTVVRLRAIRWIAQMVTAVAPPSSLSNVICIDSGMGD